MKSFFQTVSRSCLIPGIFAIACNLTQCTQPIAGGTSTTDNPKMMGTIFGDDKLPASNTRVVLIPEDLNPQRDSIKMTIDTTDENGHFVLPLTQTGVFNIEAVHLDKHTQLLIQGIKVEYGNDSVIIDNDTLKVPGNITVELPESSDINKGYVYIPGTTICASLDNDSQVILRSVPAATLPALCYASNGTDDSRVVRYNVIVQPGRTTVIVMPEWKYSKDIFLNTTADGADINGDVTNFPLCIRLDASNFLFHHAHSGGEDIRFTDANGLSLPYEIELWDAAAEFAVLWVKLDTVYGNDSSQYIVMYWGSDYAVKQRDSATILDTTDNFTAVWHLAGNTIDASASGNDGTVCSADDTVGIIGLCKKFNGNDSIIIPGLLGTPASVTLSAWVKLDSTIPRGGAEVLSIGDAVLMRMDYEHNGIGCGGAVHKSDTSVFNHLGSGRFLKMTGWHYITFTFNGNTFTSTFYIDGIPAGSRNDPGVPINYTGVGVNTCIGKHGNGKSEFGFTGCIDEARVSRVALSADYIRLCYMNQRIDDKLLVFK